MGGISDETDRLALRPEVPSRPAVSVPASRQNWRYGPTNGNSSLGIGHGEQRRQRPPRLRAPPPLPLAAADSRSPPGMGSAPPRPVRAPCRVCRSRDPAYARYSMACRTPMPVSSYPCPRSPAALLAVLSLCEDSPPRAQQGARRSASGNMPGALRAQTCLPPDE